MYRKLFQLNTYVLYGSYVLCMIIKLMDIMYIECWSRIEETPYVHMSIVNGSQTEESEHELCFLFIKKRDDMTWFCCQLFNLANPKSMLELQVMHLELHISKSNPNCNEDYFCFIQVQSSRKLKTVHNKKSILLGKVTSTRGPLHYDMIRSRSPPRHMNWGVVYPKVVYLYLYRVSENEGQIENGYNTLKCIVFDHE